MILAVQSWTTTSISCSTTTILGSEATMSLISSIHGLLSGASWQQYATILIAATVLWISYQVIYELCLSLLSPFLGPFWA